MEALALAPNGHASGDMSTVVAKLRAGEARLDKHQQLINELVGQLRAAHDRIEALEEKLTVEGFAKLLEHVARAGMDKMLADPETRKQYLDEVFAKRAEAMANQAVEERPVTQVSPQQEG
jgi:hypothetical protein